ncbi:MAG: hypothetical protein ACFB4J_08920 [Elainellaceae cyanobacterium]
MSAVPQRKSSPQRHQLPARYADNRQQPARRQPRRSSLYRIRQRGIALEMSILLGINLIVIAAASAAIVKLVPHHMAQRAKLKVLQSEVDALDRRVNDLRQNFSIYFDPQRSLINQRELGNQALPGQRPVRFVEPAPGAGESSGSRP